MPQVTFSSDKLFIIRAIRTKADGRKVTTYYETPSVWNRSPLEATVFQNYEAGEIHLNLLRLRDLPVTLKFADGSTEVMDVVPFYGEILTGPNSINIKR